ncbi:hypothetical protein T03_6063 [Trichinella britovi]|uniref:Uncharacterized protein n=1 Tax=Trichinella britovi TaxID=45882 RepID=A0A0V1CKC5_TRIBR|nr:hypothetical protein T03_6063 [Trichinella britovi]
MPRKEKQKGIQTSYGGQVDLIINIQVLSDGDFQDIMTYYTTSVITSASSALCDRERERVSEKATNHLHVLLPGCAKQYCSVIKMALNLVIHSFIIAEDKIHHREAKALLNGIIQDKLAI